MKDALNITINMFLRSGSANGKKTLELLHPLQTKFEGYIGITLCVSP